MSGIKGGVGGNTDVPQPNEAMTYEIRVFLKTQMPCPYVMGTIYCPGTSTEEYGSDMNCES